MPIAHFPPELIEEKPWLGVLIGLVAMAVFALISYSTIQDYRRYSKQRVPELLDLKQGEVELSTTRRWVTLTNFRLACEVTTKRQRIDRLDRWILGAVENTYTIIPDASGEILIIVKFDGDVRCSDFRNGPLTGVLTHTSDIMYGGVPESFGKSVRPVFYVGQGLGQTRLLLMLGIALLLLSPYLVISSAKRWTERSRAEWE